MSVPALLSLEKVFQTFSTSVIVPDIALPRERVPGVLYLLLPWSRPAYSALPSSMPVAHILPPDGSMDGAGRATQEAKAELWL